MQGMLQKTPGSFYCEISSLQGRRKLGSKTIQYGEEAQSLLEQLEKSK